MLPVKLLSARKLPKVNKSEKQKVTKPSYLVTLVIVIVNPMIDYKVKSCTNTYIVVMVTGSSDGRPPPIKLLLKSLQANKLTN